MNTDVDWNNWKCIINNQLHIVDKLATEFNRKAFLPHFVEIRSEEWSKSELILRGKRPNLHFGTNRSVHRTWGSSHQDGIQRGRRIIGKNSHWNRRHETLCHKYLPYGWTTQATLFKKNCYSFDLSIGQVAHSLRISIAEEESRDGNVIHKSETNNIVTLRFTKQTPIKPNSRRNVSAVRKGQKRM